MPINPIAPVDLGSPGGFSSLIADLRRELSDLGTRQGNVGLNAITGGNIVGGAISADHISAGSIVAGHIEAGSINAGHISANSITASHIQALAINAGHIQALAINTGHLQADIITSGHIVAGTIVAGDIQAGTITATQIAASTITGTKITTRTLDAEHIKAGVITANEIQAGTITATLIQAGTITATQIQAGTITSDRIQAGTIQSDRIAAGTIQASRIATDTLTANEIAANAITTNEIAANTIQAGDIAANTITAGQIEAGTITSAEILAGTIQASDIQSGTITATQIQAGSITGDRIAAGTITGSNLVTGTVTSTQISVSSLSAISANMGAITAGTITGGTFQTSASNPRVAIDSTGVYAQDSTGLKTFWADSATGKILALQGIGGFNIVPNSSFENATNRLLGYSTNHNLGASGTITSISSPAKYGGWALRLDSDSASGEPGFSLDPASCPAADVGKTYTASAWARPNALRDVKITLQFLDAANAGLQSTVVTQSMTGGGTWQRISATDTAPASTAKVRIICRFVTTNATDLVNFDGLQIEEGQIPTAYVPKADEVLPDTITGEELADNSVGSAHIVANTIVANDIASATITGDRIAGATITGSNIVGNTITATEIAANAITTSELNAASVNSGNIIAGAVNAAAIAANVITASHIASGTITATELAADSVGASEIIANSITANEIAANAITTNEILAGTIVASDMNVATLSAISVNAGTITAGTFRGTVFETSSATPKVRMDDTGFYVESSNGVFPVKVTAAGGLDMLSSDNNPEIQKGVRWLSTSLLTGQISSTRVGTTRTETLVHGTGISNSIPARATLKATAFGGAQAQIVMNSKAPVVGSAANQVKNAASATSNSTIGGSGGGTQSWSGLTNLASSNNAYASATIPNGATDVNGWTHWLNVTPTAFTIPAGNQIVGISVRVERKTTVASTLREYVGIRRNSLVVSSKGSAPGTFIPTSDTYITFGSSTDLWENAWDLSEINDAGFGVTYLAWDPLSALGATNTASTVTVDHVEVTVYYEVVSAQDASIYTTIGAGNNRVLINQDYDSDWMMARGYHFAAATTVQNFLSGDTSVILAASEDYALTNTANAQDAIWRSVDQSRMYAPVAGLYLFEAWVEVGGSVASGVGYELQCLKNGTGGTKIAAQHSMVGHVNLSCIVDLQVGDYVVANIENNTGTSPLTGTTAGTVSMTRLGAKSLTGV